MSLEGVAAALHASVIRETRRVVPAWVANAAVVGDRGVDDPSRNQVLARPVGTCSGGPLPSPCSPSAPHQGYDELSEDTAALHGRHLWCIQSERAAATDGRHMESADRPPADVESQLDSDAIVERDSEALNDPVNSRYD